MTGANFSENVYQKQELMRKLERHEITQEEYDVQIVAVQGKIDDEAKTIAENEKNGIVVPKPVETDGRKLRGKDADSVTNAIITCLKSGECKKASDVVARVRLMKPDRSDKKLRMQVAVVINAVKNKRTRKWLNLSWNQEKFMIVEVEAKPEVSEVPAEVPNKDGL